jgi:hypothetical protein
MLDKILISRTFTWEQMVELLENRAAGLESMKLFIVSGLPFYFPTMNSRVFSSFRRRFSG